VTLGRAIFWSSLGALVWTHAGYPLAAAFAARRRPRPVRKRDVTPSVTVIVAAHNEESVIARRVENLLTLEYPPALVDVVVASDASTDRTDAIVEEISERVGRSSEVPRAWLLRCQRGGKVRAQDLAVRKTKGEIVAFSDANALWAPDALRKLARSFGDPDVAYACGQLRLRDTDGTNLEGVYWQHEVWLREQESALGSVTGGNGAIYAVRRADYVEVDPRFGHDLSLPYLMVQRGRRAVYDSEAHAFEKPSRDLEDEYRRKVRMFEHCWLILLRGRMFRGLDPVYLVQLVSHRALRYGSGLAHLLLLATSLRLARRDRAARTALAVQFAGLGLAAAGRLRAPVPGAALAYYYLLVSQATVVALVRYLRRGVPAVWEKAEGTR
jgi:cellulose synthase/poly-beta-1,6-N-acetylglucosamine synthase-like glycosyltransferase